MKNISDTEIKITSNGPDDIYRSAALNSVGSIRLKKMEIATDKIGGLFGEFRNEEKFEDWQDLLNVLITKTKTFKEESSLVLKPSPYTEVKVLTNVLIWQCSRLGDHGIRNIMINVSGRPRLEPGLLRTLNGDGWIMDVHGISLRKCLPAVT